jgi:hypothetical protein
MKHLIEKKLMVLLILSPNWRHPRKNMLGSKPPLAKQHPGKNMLGSTLQGPDFLEEYLNQRVFVFLKNLEYCNRKLLYDSTTQKNED